MYTVDSLENAIRDLYCSGISSAGYERASVESMLDSLDFCTLLQAVRHSAETVHTYTTQGRAPKSFNYRSGELFPQRATLLYELWLLEDMSLAAVAHVTTRFCKGQYVTEYREISGEFGDPWNSGLRLDLEGLTSDLLDMCIPYNECDTPVYEL